ncbi:LysM peptidoglycan-binding domain-containing protein [Desulforamulus ruminis]|uniref:LysM peptidoglycan-binding domain-containing protein n=1 Tax=Desulforamulus ruminis TaxID=1564 RepID=UPI0023526E12|nr:LysM peptidoglycan-binding domain-containing protein [Desulforamulus ruminis]
MADYKYEIFFSFNNSAEVFQIPVNPESIEISEGGKGKTYDLVGPKGSVLITEEQQNAPGEINVIKGPKLMEVSFSSIFPAEEYPFVVVAPLPKPMKYIEDIRRWKQTKHPIRFVLVGYNAISTQDQPKPELDINIAASIEKFDWKEVAGSPGDIEYSITLKEYKFYQAQKVVEATDANGNPVLYKQPTYENTRIRPQTYTVQQGDNLWKIGMKVFGRDGRWREIQKLNGLTEADLKKLQVGTVLKIPQD